MRTKCCRCSSSMDRGLYLFTQLLALGLQIHTNEGLEESQMNAIVNENCTRYIKSQHESLVFTTDCANGYGNNSQMGGAEQSYSTYSGELVCPPWYQKNGGGKCEAGALFEGIVKSEKHTMQTLLQTFYCMTTSDGNGTNRSDVIGSCLFSFVTTVVHIYYPLPCNISKLNKYTCAGLNREGQLCGRCMKGFAPPVYSYTLNCVNCTDYHLNWLKYIGVAFGPLTVFCLLICIFHISATSAYLHGFIFFSQILTMPIILRMVGNTHGYKNANFRARASEHLYVSLLGIWNLDMFRVFYKPFCIHPDMTIVQALALDYLTALYPLVLLVITYGLVSLHAKNNRIIVTLWRPFRILLRPFRLNLDIQTSLIESFATLYLLSTMKMQSVTLDLLSPTQLYHVDGSIDEKPYLYLAGDVEYFGPEHMPYALLSLFFSVVFLLIPGLLLFLYPCRPFQRLLNAIHCNFFGLRIFMDVFQGHYKDGTNSTRDYRFFSGIFFWTRYILMTCFILLSSLYSFLAFGIIITMLGFTIAVVHPHRTRLHYILDCITLTLLSLLLFAVMGTFFGPHNSIPTEISHLLIDVAFSLPLLYITFLICYWIIVIKKIPQNLFRFLFVKLASSYEHQRLLMH